MGKTMENLAEAFAGESQANRRYLAFAKKAEAEGYPQIAKLFKTIAEAETLHAHSHFKEMGGIQSTAENLKEARKGEIYESTDMYPRFIEQAKKEGADGALRSFSMANEAEKIHAELYRKALEDLDKGKETEYYLCPVCGFVAEGDVPDVCPICGAKGSSFRKVY